MLAEKLARVPVLPPSSGYLTFWKVKPGQEVQEGEVLALYIDAVNGNSRIPAPRSGVVRSLLVEAGRSFASDSPLCYLVPAAPSPLPAMEDHAPLPAATAAPSPLSAMGAATAAPSPARPRSRRSTLGPSVEKLTMPDNIKVQQFSTRLASDQVEFLKRKPLELKLAGHDYSQAELLRAAVRWLRNLSEAELLAALERNRELEEQGGYGAGVPRPG